MWRCFIAEVFIDNAKVMAKGQVTIPNKIRDILETENGDYVIFIVDDGKYKLLIQRLSLRIISGVGNKL